MITFTIAIEECQPEVITIDFQAEGSPTDNERPHCDRIVAALRQAVEHEAMLMSNQPGGWSKSLEGPIESVGDNIEEIKNRLRQ